MEKKTKGQLKTETLEMHQCVSDLELIQTKYKQLEEELGRRNEFIDTVLDHLPVGLVVHTVDDGVVRYSNPAFRNIFSWSEDPGTNIESYFCCAFPDQVTREDLLTKLKSGFDSRDPARMKWEDLIITTAEGQKKTVTASIIPLEKQNLMISMIQDMTESKRVVDLVNHLSAHDPLTDLPNRTLFHDRLNHILNHAKRNAQMVALLFIDLDNFKSVNDAFGHKSGDMFLVQVAERLKSCLRASDTVARLGGDEFSVILEGISHSRDVIVIVQKILHSVSQPFLLEDREVYITTSIGISIYPEHGETPQVLLQNSEAAMYAAKDKGKNTHQYFVPELASKSLDRMILENELHRALERNEFRLHYQPLVDTLTREILGIEALLRWQHPVQGLLPPARFLPLAEETGLIIPIGEWVLYTACSQNVEWQKAGLPRLRIGVNLSYRQIKDPQLLNLIARVLKDTDLDPDLLELEFTENIILQNTGETACLLRDLKKLGVHLAIDDFGTGYTSLSYLTRFPFDTIKIDLSFAKKITTYPGDAVIVAGVISIANSLKMATIVEGVETTEQLKFFQEQGCSQIQGWYFSPALPADEFAKLCPIKLE